MSKVVEIAFCFFLWGLGNATKTYYVDRMCRNFPNVLINMGYNFHAGAIIFIAPDTPIDCPILLKPQYRASTVLTIKSYNLEPDDQLTIEDSDHFKVRLLGTAYYPDEKKSFFSEGLMTIHFTTNNTSNKNVKFHFIFAQTTKSPCKAGEFECRNGRCIQKNLVCDSHNHCGDRSDEQKCGPVDKKKTITRGSGMSVWLLSIIIAAVIFGIVVIAFLIVLIRRSVKDKKNKGAQTPTPNVNDNLQRPPQTLPTAPTFEPTSQISQSSSLQPGHNFGGNPPVHLQNSPMPTVLSPTNLPSSPTMQPQSSYFTQFRRSLRSMMGPRKVEIEKDNIKSKNYQVPAMYPDMQMANLPGEGAHVQNIPSSIYPQSELTPDVDGIANPNFKSEV